MASVEARKVCGEVYKKGNKEVKCPNFVTADLTKEPHGRCSLHVTCTLELPCKACAHKDISYYQKLEIARGNIKGKADVMNKKPRVATSSTSSKRKASVRTKDSKDKASSGCTSQHGIVPDPPASKLSVGKSQDEAASKSPSRTETVSSEDKATKIAKQRSLKDIERAIRRSKQDADMWVPVKGQDGRIIQYVHRSAIPDDPDTPPLISLAGHASSQGDSRGTANQQVRMAAHVAFDDPGITCEDEHPIYGNKTVPSLATSRDHDTDCYEDNIDMYSDENENEIEDGVNNQNGDRGFDFAKLERFMGNISTQVRDLSVKVVGLETQRSSSKRTSQAERSTVPNKRQKVVHQDVVHDGGDQDLEENVDDQDGEQQDEDDAAVRALIPDLDDPLEIGRQLFF